MQKSSLCKVQLQGSSLSGRPPRHLTSPRMPCSGISFLLGHLSLILQDPKGGSFDFSCCCREKPLGFLSVPPLFLFLSFSPGVTVFFLFTFSHGNKSSKVKYHSLKQLSLGQHEACYPIQEMVHTKQIHSTSSPQSPCIMSTCHLSCIMVGDLLSLGCSSFAHVLQDKGERK